jgi:hypothetical protein
MADLLDVSYLNNAVKDNATNLPRDNFLFFPLAQKERNIRGNSHLMQI